jgi:Family of unknown function (DUF6011)
MIQKRQRRRSRQPTPLSEPIDFDKPTVRCTRCRRPLKTHIAVSRGFGWRCARHLRVEAVAA